MGTLGQYLRSAREARGIDLHEAAQQTRIGVAYLKALEEEDFSKLPGEVFVRGFLKNYGKYLRLEESQVMRKYGESMAPKSAAGPVAEKEPPVVAGAEHVREHVQKTPRSTTIETILWGAGILIALILFLFTSLPNRRHQEAKHVATPLSTEQTATAAPGPVMQTGKLYLEVVALEDTWLLVRTDSSPQKKALLKKGENLIWSADERFLLSYSSAKALKLILNGQELVMTESGKDVVRDLAITASGIVSSKLPDNKVPGKKRPTAEQQLQKPAQVVYGPQLPATTTNAQKPALAGPPAPAAKPTPTQTRH